MAKTVEQDIQILLSMLGVQSEIEDLIDSVSEEDSETVTAEEVALNDKTYKLVYFNLIRFINLTKHLSTKTKKETLLFMDDFKNKAVLENLEYCYPRISKEEIVKYAAEIADTDNQYALRERYSFCLEKVENKGE